RTTWAAYAWPDVVGICSVYVVIIECEVRVYEVAMVSTGMKIPMAVEAEGAVRNVPMAVEAVEADKGWMNVPMAVET
ncbi:MAG TPA: hypothetical protein VEH06_14125, partial [Candidatus Bathyarchaeia archaeon]|nr:hypothetical protein [Candidatus Bathyarchaeia archaeon]